MAQLINTFKQAKQVSFGIYRGDDDSKVSLLNRCPFFALFRRAKGTGSSRHACYFPRRMLHACLCSPEKREKITPVLAEYKNVYMYPSTVNRGD